MCGRYTLIQTEGLQVRYGTENGLEELKPSYNVAPGLEHPVVLAGKEGKNVLVTLRWGLTPKWAKEPTQISINARAETILEKPSFRTPFLKQRCLVPADGFYEWGGEQEKRPWYFSLKNREVFSLAAIYDEWRYSGGKVIRGYSILTTEPNALVMPVHERMPVILRREDERDWLYTPAGEAEGLSRVLNPFPAEVMQGYPVSFRVNKAGEDNQDLIKEVRA